MPRRSLPMAEQRARATHRRSSGRTGPRTPFDHRQIRSFTKMITRDSLLNDSRIPAACPLHAAYNTAHVQSCCLRSCPFRLRVCVRPEFAGPAPPDLSQEAFVFEHLNESVRFEDDGSGMRESTAAIRIES